MKQNWKRTLQGALLGAALLAMAGCGSKNVMDTYSFGHQVIRAGQSEITILCLMKWVKVQKICLMMGIQLIFMDLLQTIW